MRQMLRQRGQHIGHIGGVLRQAHALPGVAWQNIELVVINIQGDFQPFPSWYIFPPYQGVRLHQETPNMAYVLSAL